LPGIALQEGGPAALASQGALAGAALLAVGLALVPLGALALRRLAGPRAEPRARWGGTDVLATAAVYVAGAQLAQVALPPPGDAGLALLLARAAAVDVAAAALAVALALRPAAGGPGALGLRRGANARAVAAGVALYALALPALLGLEGTWPWLLERLGGTWKRQQAQDAFALLEGRELWAAAFLAVALVPLLEELLFRGFLQPALVRGLGARGGVLATSILFALLHGSSAFLPLFGLSLVLGAVMLRTQRLAAPCVIHGLNNALAILLVRHFPELRAP